MRTVDKTILRELKEIKDLLAFATPLQELEPVSNNVNDTNVVSELEFEVERIFKLIHIQYPDENDVVGRLKALIIHNIKSGIRIGIQQTLIKHESK